MKCNRKHEWTDPCGKVPMRFDQDRDRLRYGNIPVKVSDSYLRVGCQRTLDTDVDRVCPKAYEQFVLH